MKLRGGNFGFGILFGWKDPDHHFIIDLETDGESLTIRVDKVGMVEILECYSITTAIQEAWLEKGLRIHMYRQGNLLRFQVGNLKPRFVELGPGAAKGKMGLSATGGRSSKSPVIFEHLLLIEY